MPKQKTSKTKLKLTGKQRLALEAEKKKEKKEKVNTKEKFEIKSILFEESLDNDFPELKIRKEYLKLEIPCDISDKLASYKINAISSTQTYEEEISNLHWTEIPVSQLIYDIGHTYYILSEWFNPLTNNKTNRKSIPRKHLDVIIKGEYDDFICKLTIDRELQSLFLWAIHRIHKETTRLAFVNKIFKTWRTEPLCFSQVADEIFNGAHVNLWKPISTKRDMPQFTGLLNKFVGRQFDVSFADRHFEEFKITQPRDLEIIRQEILERLGRNKCQCCVKNFEKNHLKDHMNTDFKNNFSEGLLHFGLTEPNSDNQSDKSTDSNFGGDPAPIYNDPRYMDLEEFAKEIHPNCL